MIRGTPILGNLHMVITGLSEFIGEMQDLKNNSHSEGIYEIHSRVIRHSWGILHKNLSDGDL